MAQFVSYLRVSTAKQGTSGLGLEAQREAVAKYLQGCVGKLVQELVEVESGKQNGRPKLDEALRMCRRRRATLIIGKLDRLSRDTEFLLKIVRESGEAGVVFCDLPSLPAGPVGKFMVTQMASVAELEAGLISQRTKAALAAAKARGVRLGRRTGHAELVRMSAKGKAAATAALQAGADKRAADVLPVVQQIRSEVGQLSLRQLANELNIRGEQAPRGGEWSAVQVMRLLARVEKGMAA